MSKINPKLTQNWNLAKIVPKSEIKASGTILGECLNYKMYSEFWFGHQKCHFLGSENSHFWQMFPFSDQKNDILVPKSKFWDHFYSSNFVQICPLMLYFMNLSRLRTILAISSFGNFLANFGYFSLVKRGKNNTQFW